MTRTRKITLGTCILLLVAFATAAQAQDLVFYTLNDAVGAGLQTSSNRIRLSDGQHGGITVRVESPDTNLVRITDDEDIPGGQYADIFVPNGSQDVYFYVQAMEDTTAVATLTATAPGFTPATDSIEVRDPALRISGLTGSLGPYDPIDQFTVSVGLANGTNSNLTPSQKVRVGGPGLTATISTTDAAIGVLETTVLTAQVVSVAIAPGNASSPSSVANGGVAFDGLTPGSVDVDVVIPGFSPVNSVPQTVTVTAPEITWFGMPSSVGSGLMAAGKRARLSGSVHGGTLVTITSSDSTKVLIAPDDNTPGAGSLQVFVSDGSIDAIFCIQALEGVMGDVPIFATAAGFPDGFTVATVAQPFFRLNGLGPSIDTLDPTDAFWASVGLPNGSFTNITPSQKARIGGPGLTVTFSSSDPAIGLLETTSALQDTIVLTIPPGEYNTPTSVAYGGVAFDGVGVGVSTVTAAIPGFAPVSTGMVDVTVSQPSLTMSANAPVGAGLRTARYYVQLGASQHGGVVVRIESSDPSLALVSPEVDSVGQPFIDVPVADGSTIADYWVHGLEDTTGTLTITGTSPLFQPASGNAAVMRPAVKLNGLLTTVDTIDPVDAFWVSVGYPNTGGTNIFPQVVRPGGAGFVIDLTTDDPAKGVITTLAGTSDAETVSIPALQSNSPTTVAAGGSAFDGLAPGPVLVAASSPRVDQITSSTKTVTVTAPTMNLSAVSTLGWGLQATGYVQLSAGGHGGVMVRVESLDPSKLLVSASESTMGAAFADIWMPDGSTYETFYTQALDGQTGMVHLASTSPLFTSSADSVPIVQPGVEITSLSASQDVADNPDVFYARVGVPNYLNSAITSGLRQERRAGAPPLEVLFVSDDGAVAEIVTNSTSDDSVTIFIQPGESQTPTSLGLGGTALDGLSYGQTLVTAEIATFIQTGAAQKVVDVSNLNITLNGLADRLGAGLQSEAVSAELGEGGHGGVTVHVAVDDPALAVVSANALVGGAETLDISLGSGETEAVFYVQALDASAGNTVNVSATVTGFASGTQDVDLVPAGTVIILLPDSMDVNVDDDDFVVQVGAITPDTTGIVEPQALRGGGPSRTLTLISSEGDIGLLTTQTAVNDTITLTLDPGERQTAATWGEGGVAFDPIYPGQTTVSAAIAGFLTTDTGMQLVTMTGEVLSIGDVPVAVFKLDQNVPNPFNPVTKIAFSLDKTGPVDLAVYDVSGRRVVTLVREERAAGPHVVQWDGTDDAGARVSSGIYLYKLEAGDKVDVNKMTLLK